MVKLIPEKSIRTDSGKYFAMLYADTWAELEGVTSAGGVELDAGSQALTADGEGCVLDSSGAWHKKDGTVIGGD